jgi:archaeal type IV pilus assembly protein PilA
MKGISEIIAIILILMIVIALAALAYTWFSGIFNQMTTNAGTSVTQSTNTMGTAFKIENIRNVTPTNISVTIRNLGTQSISLTNAGAYYDGVPATNTNISASSVTVAPSATSTISIGMTSITCGKSLMLTVTTGASDSATLTC